MSLALLFLYLMLNMFRMLIHPSSGTCNLFVEIFHGLYCSGSMCVGVKLYNVTPTHIEPEQYNPWNISTNKSQVPEDGCINIRNMLGIKWRNNKANDIKLVSLYSTIKMMHGPIYVRYTTFYFPCPPLEAVLSISRLCFLCTGSRDSCCLI